MRDPLIIVHRPLLTEKNTQRAERLREYTFSVASNANKIEIRQAVEVLYGVKVVAVRTSIAKGQLRRVGWRTTRAPDRKKAIVKLAEGQKIDLI